MYKDSEIDDLMEFIKIRVPCILVKKRLNGELYELEREDTEIIQLDRSGSLESLAKGSSSELFPQVFRKSRLIISFFIYNDFIHSTIGSNVDEGYNVNLTSTKELHLNDDGAEIGLVTEWGLIHGYNMELPEDELKGSVHIKLIHDQSFFAYSNLDSTSFLEDFYSYKLIYNLFIGNHKSSTSTELGRNAINTGMPKPGKLFKF